MSLESDLFMKRKPDEKKLRSFGFVRASDGFLYERTVLDGKFRAVVRVSTKGDVSGDMIDAETDEEYLPLHMRHADNTTANLVRSAYLDVLREVAEKCFVMTEFMSDQTIRMASWIQKEFGEEPDNPFSDVDAAIFRNRESRKWYAIVMIVEKGKVLGTKDESRAEVMNLKVPKERLEEILQIKGIYPAYHMNKKSWVSIIMDNTVPDPWVEHLLEQSRSFTETRNPQNAPHDWIVPANPKYYDVLGNLKAYGTLEWPGIKGVKANDTVYIYYAAPYSCLLMKCRAVSFTGGTDAAGLTLEEVYDKDRYPLALLKEKGLNSVRFARRIPYSLKEYLEEDNGVQ